MKTRPSTRQDVRDLLTTLTSPRCLPTVTTSSWAEMVAVMSAFVHSRTLVAGDAVTVTPPASLAGLAACLGVREVVGPGVGPRLGDDGAPDGGRTATARSLACGSADAERNMARIGEK